MGSLLNRYACIMLECVFTLISRSRLAIPTTPLVSETAVCLPRKRGVFRSALAIC